MVPDCGWWVRFAEAEHSRRMLLPWDQLCWHLWGGQAGCCLLFPAHTQGASCTKWHQGSLFSSDATFVTCYQVNCDKIDWSSPESDTVLRWLLCAQQAGTELYRTAGFSILKEQRALMDSREFRSESAYDASFLQTLCAWDEGELCPSSGSRRYVFYLPPPC